MTISRRRFHAGSRRRRGSGLRMRPKKGRTTHNFCGGSANQPPCLWKGRCKLPSSLEIDPISHLLNRLSFRGRAPGNPWARQLHSARRVSSRSNSLPSGSTTGGAMRVVRHEFDELGEPDTHFFARAWRCERSNPAAFSSAQKSRRPRRRALRIQGRISSARSDPFRHSSSGAEQAPSFSKSWSGFGAIISISTRPKAKTAGSRPRMIARGEHAFGENFRTWCAPPPLAPPCSGIWMGA